MKPTCCPFCANYDGKEKFCAKYERTVSDVIVVECDYFKAKGGENAERSGHPSD